MLLEVVLPLRMLTLANVLELVAWVQQRNHRIYLSHKNGERQRGEKSEAVGLLTYRSEKKIRGTWVTLGAIVIIVVVLVLGAAE